MIVKPTTSLAIERWYSGLYTQRSPLVTPITVQGINVLQRFDTLIGGLNVELSNKNTIERRPGWSQQCTASAAAPLNFHSFENNAGTIKLLVDNATKVQTFTASVITDVYTKGSAAQSWFLTVGDYVYIANGTDAQKWDQTTATKWGIVAPAAAPTWGTAAGSLSPTRGYSWVAVYKNSLTGHISTASPISSNTGARTNVNFTLSGTGSADTQVDKIDIYRIKDGGSVYYFLAEIANPGAIAWNYTDSSADTALNTLLIVPPPGNHANDPPPTGANVSVFHSNRIWVAAANKVYFAAGPDTVNGRGDESFPPANVFAFPGAVTALASTSDGLLVFTRRHVFVILGTDSSNYYSKRFLSNFGVPSQNCIAQDGDLLYMFTSARQLFELSDTGLTDVGFDIGDLLASIDPATVYMALHRAGQDGGLFITNGTSGWYRYNVAKAAWSPLGTFSGGNIGPIVSAAVTSTTQRLLMGTAAAGPILYRDVTNWQDNGTNFTANAVVGTLVLATLGSTANVEAVLLERVATGTDFTVGVLINEITGSFTTIPNPVAEPPLLPASTTIIAKRHYLKAAATPVAQKVHHMQIQVTFATENAHSELYTLAVMPPNAA